MENHFPFNFPAADFYLFDDNSVLRSAPLDFTRQCETLFEISQLSSWDTLMILKYKYFLLSRISRMATECAWLLTGTMRWNEWKIPSHFRRVHTASVAISPAIHCFASGFFLSCTFYDFSFPVYTRRKCLNSRTLVCSIKMPKKFHPHYILPLENLKHTTRKRRDVRNIERKFFIYILVLRSIFCVSRV